MFKSLYICLSAYNFVCMFVRTFVCIYISVCMVMYMCLYVCMPECMVECNEHVTASHLCSEYLLAGYTLQHKNSGFLSH